MFEEPVFAQEIQTCCRIKIVLVFGRFLRFWLEVKGSLKADLFLVINSHMQKFRQVFQFPFHISVPEAGIPFAAAPEDVACRAQCMSDFDCLLHLRGCVDKYVGIRTGGRSMRETRMDEQAGGGPE